MGQRSNKKKRRVKLPAPRRLACDTTMRAPEKAQWLLVPLKAESHRVDALAATANLIARAHHMGHIKGQS